VALGIVLLEQSTSPRRISKKHYGLLASNLPLHHIIPFLTPCFTINSISDFRGYRCVKVFCCYSLLVFLLLWVLVVMVVVDGGSVASGGDVRI